MAEKRVWTAIMRPGIDYLDECLQKGKVVIGWGIEGHGHSHPLPIGQLREAIKKVYYPNDPHYRGAGQAAGMVSEFCSAMRKGDYVIVPEPGYRFFLAEVLRDEYDYERECYWREVRWIFGKENPASWQNVPTSLNSACRTRRTLKNSDHALGEIQKLLSDKDYFGKRWDSELVEELKKTVFNYHQTGRMNFSRFQAEVVPRLLRAMGANDLIENRSGESDVGIDLVATFPVGSVSSVRVGVQVKFYTPEPPLSVAVIDQTMRGAIEESVDQAWIVTTGKITPAVFDYVRTQNDTMPENWIPLKLIDGDEWSRIVLDYIGKCYGKTSA